MPPTSKRRRRPDVTPDEKAALLAVCREIRAEEPELSVRGYIYRICDRANVYLHGDLCVRDIDPLDPPPGENGNEETIQRLLLEFRRAGLIPYESIIDGTRQTTFAEGGYDNIDEARESMAEARQRVVESYELNIWTPQGKRVEFLSEKEALSVIVERVTNSYQVNHTASKGFSSESMLYRVARRTALSGTPTTFLILTDHDRAGYNMTDHVEREMRRLVELICDQLRLPVPPLEFVRVGLTAEQVTRYRMRTNRPKPSEHPGMDNYVANPIHVDALRSAQIEEIVREGIEDQLNMRLLRRTRRQEAIDKAVLQREIDAEEQEESGESD